MDATPELLDWILSEISGGTSQRQIAEALAIPRSRLIAWLSADDDIRSRSARAMADSAEAWLDKGQDAIASSMLKAGPVDPTAARAYAQECARRAAIRNPKYRDKQDIGLSAPDGGPVRAITRIEYVVVDPKAPNAESD